MFSGVRFAWLSGILLLFSLVSCYQTPVTPTPVTPTPVPQPGEPLSFGSGLRADYYQSADFSGRVVSRVDRQIFFDWGQVAPAQGLVPGVFSARWQGILNVETTDSYSFFVDAEGQATLRIDGKAVSSGTPVQLAAGSHEILLEFVKTSDTASLRLEWQSSTLTRAVIAQQYLQPALLYSTELTFANVVTNTNLLLNSDFEGGTGNWIKYGSNTNFGTVSPGRSGTGQALKASGWLWIQQDLPVSSIEVSQTYTLRGFAKATSGGTCTLGLSGGSTTTELFNETVSVRSTSWQEQSTSLKVPSGTIWMAVYLSTTQSECQFDDVTLVTGTTTTPPVASNNLVDNSSFETDFESWGRYGGTSAITTPGQNGAGKSLQTSNFAWIQQDLAGTSIKAQPYTLSGYARSATGSVCTIGLMATDATQVIIDVKLEFTATTWQQKTLRQTFPRGVTWAGVYAASGSTNCFFDDISLSPVALSPKATQGEWSNVLNWPLIATHMANLRDGRVLAWSSYDVDRFGGRPDLQYTQAVIYNPSNNTFQKIDNPQHDMFCAGLAMLPDGRVFAGGGGDGVNRTRVSVFNGSSWSRLPDMPNGHWYGTAVAMPNGDVFLGYGRSSNLRSDIYRSGTNTWQNLSGINLTGITGTGLETPDLYPYLHVSPRGTIFHSGATTTMHELNVSGNGTTTVKGNRATGEVYRQWGSAIMVDKGKLMLVGGTPQQTTPGSLKSAVLIDINSETPVATRLPDMNYTRTYHSTILLPNGEVFVAGGNGNGVEFVDTDSRLVAEIYSPASNSWREVAAMSVPRNYHSTGTLLQDGRVLLAGGGLCGTCAANHQDGQIYSPPYLFNPDGTPAARPSITTSPNVIGYNQNVNVMVSGSGAENIRAFTLIKLSANTHAMNTDVRRMNVDFVKNAGLSYTLTTESNLNIMTPGYYYLFAVNSDGVPSVARIIRIG
jgi:galactose oxidase